MTTIQETPATAAPEDTPQAAEVTVEQPVVETPTVPDEPQEHPIVAHLRECLANFMADADRLAEYGGIERKTAAEHLEQAGLYDDAAVTVRAQADIWQRLLDNAIAEVAREQHAVDVQRAEAAELAELETPRGGNPYPVMVHCNRCGTAVRPLTPGEQADLQAGLPMPDVRRECPDCQMATHTGPAES